MPVFSSLLAAAFYVTNSVLTLYFWIVLVSAAMSWINPDPYNPIVIRTSSRQSSPRIFFLAHRLPRI